MTPPKKIKGETGKKVVRGFAILDIKRGRFIYAECVVPNAAMYMGSGTTVMGRDAAIVNCTITYELPTPTTKKRKQV